MIDEKTIQKLLKLVRNAEKQHSYDISGTVSDLDHPSNSTHTRHTRIQRRLIISFINFQDKRETQCSVLCAKR